jgi:cytochrome c-type biogenesis protein CcmH/NrfG
MKRRQAYSALAISFIFSLAAVAQTQKGIDLYNSGQCSEAETVLRAALKSDPSDTLATYYLGLSLLPQENYNEALDLFVKVKRSQRPPVPNEYEIQLALARARIGLKQYDEAWKNLENAGMEDAQSSDVYVYRGVYYLQQEKHAEAIKELEKAIKLDSKNPYAYYYAGLAYFGSGNGQKAVDDLKMFLQLFPSAPESGKAKEIIEKLC